MAWQGSAENITEAVDYLVFFLGTHAYAVRYSHVQEIRSYDARTMIVSVPGFIKGAMDLRGTRIPVVDMRSKLNNCANQGGGDREGSGVVIVLRLHESVIGFIADGVSHVLSATPDQVSNVPELSAMVALCTPHAMECFASEGATDSRKAMAA